MGRAAARFGPLVCAVACCGFVGAAHARIDEYRLDDGAGESALGVAGEGRSIAWLNQFTVTTGAEIVTGIRVAFGRGTLLNGAPVTAYLWNDPNGDGNPNDAQVITSLGGVIQNANQTQPLTQFQLFDMNDTVMGSSGTSFFAGFIFNSSSLGAAAGIDLTPPISQRSWVAMSGSGFVDPNNLQGSAKPGLFGLVGSFPESGAPGNWMVRADAIPSPSAVVVLVSLGALVGRRR